jgi:hypothetical protein
MAVRERARLGAVALGAGAAVLALIQILEQSVSAFSPRPIVSALITIVVAGVGATLARARTVSQRRQFLSNVLRQSPMPAAAEADPYMLGVFRPRTQPEDGIGPYVPRSVDDPLEQALARKSGFVLLIGEARAGKSRSAYEAVLRRLPDQKLLVPYGGEALPSIIGDPALRNENAVWWLDDLGRFLAHLDGPSLDELLNGGHVVVASVRADTWDALLKADGDAGEQARNLLAAAFTVHMDAEHSPEELAEASRLYPDLDVSDGIGPALAADVPESREPVTRPPEHEETPHRFDPLLGLLLIGTLAASVFLAGLIVGGGFSDKAPPPIATQVEQILGDGYRSGKQLVYYNLDADLHGLNQQSWIFLWRSRTGSDELKIYDEVNGRLALHLDFPAGSTAIGPLRVLNQRLVNVDGFFETQLVAAYSTPSMWPGEVPFVISWNEARGRYVLAPLLPKSVSTKTVPTALAPRLQRPVRVVYRAGSTHSVKAYPVDEFELVPAKGTDPALLVVATTTDQKIHDLGLTVPAVALTTYSMRPLISTDGVPQLACVYPAPTPQKKTILEAEAPLTSLGGLTEDPFAPTGSSASYGFYADSSTNGGTSGGLLLSERARHVRQQSQPCGTASGVGTPVIVQPHRKKKSR